jgi:hypothetical protein
METIHTLLILLTMLTAITLSTTKGTIMLTLTKYTNTNTITELDTDDLTLARTKIKMASDDSGFPLYEAMVADHRRSAPEGAYADIHVVSSRKYIGLYDGEIVSVYTITEAEGGGA